MFDKFGTWALLVLGKQRYMQERMTQARPFGRLSTVNILKALKHTAHHTTQSSQALKLVARATQYFTEQLDVWGVLHYHFPHFSEHRLTLPCSLLREAGLDTDAALHQALTLGSTRPLTGHHLNTTGGHYWCKSPGYQPATMAKSQVVGHQYAKHKSSFTHLQPWVALARLLPRHHWGGRHLAVSHQSQIATRSDSPLHKHTVQNSTYVYAWVPWA